MLTPEFVMPPETVEPPILPATQQPSGEPDRADRDPTADRDDVVLERERPPWRQLLIVGLVGVLVGSAVLATLQTADRTAADARVQSLRSMAEAYLSAIADGDAALATAMVPVPGEVAPAGVLRSADRISGIEVRFVVVDEEAGSVEVRYQVGSVREQRTLTADRAEGEWRLTASLAEPVVVRSPDGSTGATVGGVELSPSRAVMLYPGRYTVDRISTSLLRSGGEPFEVDGDPESTSELSTSVEPTDAFRDAAVDVAETRVESCQQLPDCPVGRYTVPPPIPEAPQILGVDAAAGAIDLVVLLGLDAAAGGRRQELELRALVDEAGAVESWECGVVDRPHHALEPCGP